MGGKMFKNYEEVNAFLNEEVVELIDFKPQVSVKEGVKNFIDWYKEYYDVN